MFPARREHVPVLVGAEGFGLLQTRIRGRWGGAGGDVAVTYEGMGE